MAEMALQYLQSAHNQVGIAQDSWTGWANALAPEYDAARDNYVGAVGMVEQAIRLKREQMWQLLGYMVGAFAVPWAARFLSPAKRMLAQVRDQAVALNEFDDLTSAMLKDAVEKMAGTAKDSLKGSLIDFVKSKAMGSTTDPFKATVEKTAYSRSL